jgi:D-aminoacyl-tRNA deacylase
MNNLLIIGSEKDIASRIVYKKSIELFHAHYSDYHSATIPPCPLHSYASIPGMMFDNIDFMLIDESLLHFDIDMHAGNYDSVCFLSRHAAKSGNNSITMHPIGNFGDAIFGGKDRAIVRPAINLMNSLYHTAVRRRISTNIGDYEVSFEATHHGPYSERKCVFFELGSSDKNWNNDEAAAIMAILLLDALKERTVRKAFFGIGSSHYCSGFNGLFDENDFAGSCPEYALSRFSEDHAMFISSFASLFAIHHNIKKSEKARIISILERLKLQYMELSV